MPLIQAYRQAYPQASDDDLQRLIACDAFMRRAAQVPHPLILKGSYLTRQYFPDPAQRLFADLDFVLQPHYDDIQAATRLLSQWMQAVTTFHYPDDGVTFAPFAENTFWRNVDYAMSDDFPTVNTDFECRADGWECEANLDVSLNLNIAHPHPFTFATPIDRFTMPLTTPLHYQIAWKLHQTIVRPRFKDLYDLSRLAPAIGSLKAAGCNEVKTGNARFSGAKTATADKADANQHDNPPSAAQTLRDTLAVLADECRRDHIKPRRILDLFDYDYKKTFGGIKAHDIWKWERLGGTAWACPDMPDSPEATFEQYAQAMREAGFTRQNAEKLLG